MYKSLESINFIDLSFSEKEMVLKWRNHPTIRQWMHTSEPISLAMHLSFIESLKNTTDKIYYILKAENSYLGVVDFTNITQETLHIGLYKNPFLQKSIGQILLDFIITYAFKKLMVKRIFAEVLIKNKKAYKLYEKNNFKVINNKVINNKKTICMELKNDDQKEYYV